MIKVLVPCKFLWVVPSTLHSGVSSVIPTYLGLHD